MCYRLIWSKGIIFFIFVFLFSYSCNKDSRKTESKTIVPSESIYKVNFIGQWMKEGKREHIIRNFVSEYSFQNQEVNINLKFPEDIGFDRYNTESTYAFFSELLKQEVPDWDVVLINDDFEGIGNFIGDPNWAKKYLVDFSVYPEISEKTINEIDLEKVKKRWKGIIPGPFLEGQYWALYTNKKVAEKLGIVVKQYGMTFDDFLSYIKAVNEYNKVNTDKIVAFQESYNWKSSFSVAIQLYLSIVNDIDAVYRDEVTEQKLKAWYKTLQALEELSTYKPLNEDWKTALWNDHKSDLLYEKSLFFANGSWMYNTWFEIDDSLVYNCLPTEFPTFNKIGMFPGGFPIMWGVLKNSPNKEQAIRFLLGMNKPEMAEAWIRNTKCPTGIKGSLSDVSFGSDQFESFSYEIQRAYGKNMYKMNESSMFIYGQKLMYEPNYYIEVLNGEISADKAMVLIRKNVSKYVR